jgi:hypothetical protein
VEGFASADACEGDRLIDEANVNVHLVTVIGTHLGVHLGIFAEMLKHYRQLGIESLLVNLQPHEFDDAFHREVRTIVMRYGGRIDSVFVGPWGQSVNTMLYRNSMERAPRDWFVLADTDEFQVYPDGVMSVLENAERAGYDYISGFVIDRIADDGGFPAVSAHPPAATLWQQFPLAGLITFPLLGANVLKVVAAKGWVLTAPGQHHAYHGRGCPPHQYYIPVHHFKWTSGVVERLRERIEYLKATNSILWHESDRFIKHCDAHGGRIDISDPRFMLARCDTGGAHEAVLKERVLENTDHMPAPLRL